MDRDKETFELSCMLVALLDGTITSEQFTKLREKLSTDPSAREYYYDFVLVHTRLNARGGVSSSIQFDKTEDLSSFDYELWQSLAVAEKTAVGINIEKSKKPGAIEQAYSVQSRPVSRRVSKPLLYTAILSSAALIFILLFVQIHSLYESRVVATLVDSVDVKWADGSRSIENGTLLRNNMKSLFLKRGVAKIVFEYGAEVLVEGPAEFELKDKDEIALFSGRLYTTVPKHAIGFSVNTPSSSLIDLGTEFGVKVDFDGTTDVHMIKGQASLVTGKKGQTSSSTIINSGQAKRVNTSGTTTDIELQEKAFVRKVSSQDGLVWRGEALSLADIVGGGNGFGAGLQFAGIMPHTGEFLNSYVENYKAIDLLNYSYSKVSELSFVDGVFVPHTGPDGFEISSEGHVFRDCSYAEGSYFAKAITNGRESKQWFLNGVAYGTPEHAAIVMQRNKGITFDLDAIRKAMPEMKPVRLKSLFGISETVLREHYEGVNKTMKVSVHVLVDGKERFCGKGITIDSKPTAINVELNNNDRFLTLMTTYEKIGLHNLSFFAEPVLELEY